MDLVLFRERVASSAHASTSSAALHCSQPTARHTKAGVQRLGSCRAPPKRARTETSATSTRTREVAPSHAPASGKAVRTEDSPGIVDHNQNVRDGHYEAQLVQKQVRMHTTTTDGLAACTAIRCSWACRSRYPSDSSLLEMNVNAFK